MNKYELFLGDCIQYMKTMPSGSVDACILDLPYGTTACSWDEIIPFVPMWEQVKRINKGAFVTTASQPFTSKLIMSNLVDFRYEWIWEKSRKTGFLDCNDKPLKGHENIVIFYEKKITFNPQMIKGRKHSRGGARTGPAQMYGNFSDRKTTENDLYYPQTVLYYPVEMSAEHPTQKPVSLFSYLIQTYTNIGDTVLDFTMGSGTTGVACMQLGRKFIGCELDAGYFKIAEKRIKAAASQDVLFA